ncbi:MAG: choice-of-anchor D domain-containing protein [Bacteroidota bacterium]|jgi:DNA/RNA endonuclease YhcR with UshA esterase domain
MKRSITIFFLLLCTIVLITANASAQSLFKEDFNYTTGDSLTHDGWLVSSGGTTLALLATSPGLTFTNYASSGIGNCTKLDTTGQDLYKSFPADSVGSVYLAFMLNVTKAATTGDYFVALSPSSSQTNYYARTFIKSSGAGFVVGISKSNETAVYDTTVFSLNTTYLAVVKYTFVKADSDIINVYMLPAGTSLSSEPTTPKMTYQDKTKSDATNLKFVTLRQGTAANAPRLFIDGVRIGTTWNDVFFSTLRWRSSIDFGTVNLGSAPKDSFYVKNTDSIVVSISSVTSSNTVFAVTPATANIAIADSQKFVVTYTPTSTGVSTGKISITPTGSTAPDTIAVTGSCVQAGFSISKSSSNFGNVFKDSTKTDTVTVSNASTSGSLVIDSVRSDNSVFNISPTSGTVGTSSYVKFAVSFKPIIKGAASANIIFYHNAPSHRDTLKVSGNGILKEPLFSVTPASLDFRGILVGQSKIDSLTVKNVGYDSLIISNVISTDGVFALTPTTARLDTNKSQKFYLTFTPTAVGIKAASIVFTSNVSEIKDTVKVAGSGSAVVTIAEARKDLNNDLIADHSLTGDTLFITGVITTPNMGASAGQTSYFIQDATGGIDAFAYGLVSTTYAIGDSIMVTGTVTQYHGLDELMIPAWDDAHVTLLKHNAAVPAPKHLTLHQFVLNAENYEGQLIELDTLYKATGTWPAAAANTSIYVRNASKTDTTQIFLDLDANIAGTEPGYPINVVGFVSQYSSSSTVYNNGYEICPRMASDITHTIGVGVDKLQQGIPTTFELSQNYPNPFNPSTTIEYALPLRSTVTIKIYSILGQEITTLINGEQSAGHYQTIWNASNVASGMYFLRISAQSIDGSKASFIKVRKMSLMK